MKIKKLPLSLKERWCERLRKLLVCLMIVVTIITSLGIFIFKDFGLGYKYYEINNCQTVYVGTTQEENFLIKVRNEYLDKLTSEGYYISSSEFNTHFLEQMAIIPKSTINEEDIKKAIISSLDITVLATKLNIENDETIYYFKTQSECDEFVNSLNQYIKQECSSVGVVEDYKLITEKSILETKIDNVRKEKEKLDAEEAERKAALERKQAEQRSKQITSRGGTTTRTSNYSGGVPLASYSYISSPYGMRHGKMHTGVDFAASAGTHIYAWKSGTVTFAGWSGSYGNFIIVQHNDGTVSRYAHCSGFAVSAGTSVEKGQTIGYVGTTGNSTGNHLHFEIQINGSFVNPLDYL